MKRLLAALLAVVAALVVNTGTVGADPPIGFWNGANYVIYPDAPGRHIAYTREGALEIDGWQTADAHWIYGPNPFFYVCPNPPASMVWIYHTDYGGDGGRFQAMYLTDDYNRYLGSVYTDTAYSGRIIAYADGGQCIRWNVW